MYNMRSTIILVVSTLYTFFAVHAAETTPIRFVEFSSVPQRFARRFLSITYENKITDFQYELDALMTMIERTHAACAGAKEWFLSTESRIIGVDIILKVAPACADQAEAIRCMLIEKLKASYAQRIYAQDPRQRTMCIVTRFYEAPKIPQLPSRRRDVWNRARL